MFQFPDQQDEGAMNWVLIIEDEQLHNHFDFQLKKK